MLCINLAAFLKIYLDFDNPKRSSDYYNKFINSKSFDKRNAKKLSGNSSKVTSTFKKGSKKEKKSYVLKIHIKLLT